MADAEKIDIGDLVKVIYNDGVQVTARVIGVPWADADMWKFKDLAYGVVIYQNPTSSNFDCIILLEKNK